MRAVAHGWKKPGGGGPSKKVAKEFFAADKKRKKYKRSTKAKVNNPDTRHGKLDMPFKSLKRFAGMAEGGDVMKAKKSVRKMQDGGMTAPMTAPRTPTLPSQANARATTALGNRGMMGRPTVPPAPSDMAARDMMRGRGMEMRNIPTLPDQASQRARDLMASRKPPTTGGPLPPPAVLKAQPMPVPGDTVYAGGNPDFNEMEQLPIQPTPTSYGLKLVGDTKPLPPLPLQPQYAPSTGIARPTGFKKGGKIKRMAGGGGTNPRKGGALYNKGTNFNPNMQAGGKVPTAPSLPSQASSKAGAAMSRFAGAGKRPGMQAGGRVPTAPSLPSQASSKASDAMSRFAGAGNRPGYKKGGMPKVKKYAAGGAVSKRADGCCMKGRTKGRMR